MITIEDLEEFAERSESMTEEILAREFINPESVKQSPLFSASKAAKFLGITRQRLTVLMRENPHLEATIKVNEETGKTLPPLYSTQQMEAVRKCLSRVQETKPVGAKPFVIACSNLKGGSGKSQLSLNLSTSFALRGYKTLLIDSDPQHTSSDVLGFTQVPNHKYEIFDENTLLDLYAQNQPLRPLKSYIENLSVIPATIALYQAEFILPQRQIEQEQPFFNILDYALKTNIEDWEYEILSDYEDEEEPPAAYDKEYTEIVIIDCPPSYSFASLNALYAADAIIATTPPYAPDIAASGVFFRQLSIVLDAIRNHEGKGKEYEFISGLTTKMEGSAEAIQNDGRLKGIFRENQLNMTFNLSKAISVANDKGKTVYEIDNYKDVAKSTVEKTIDNIEAITDSIESKIKAVWNKQLSLEGVD